MRASVGQGVEAGTLRRLVLWVCVRARVSEEAADWGGRGWVTPAMVATLVAGGSVGQRGWRGPGCIRGGSQHLGSVSAVTFALLMKL